MPARTLASFRWIWLMSKVTTAMGSWYSGLLITTIESVSEVTPVGSRRTMKTIILRPPLQ